VSQLLASARSIAGDVGPASFYACPVEFGLEFREQLVVRIDVDRGGV
jgi:hypothetical protein